MSGPILYTYVWNNPTNLTDPTGFDAAPTASQQAMADKIQGLIDSGTTVVLQGIDGEASQVVGNTQSGVNAAISKIGDNSNLTQMIGQGTTSFTVMSSGPATPAQPGMDPTAQGKPVSVADNTGKSAGADSQPSSTASNKQAYLDYIKLTQSKSDQDSGALAAFSDCVAERRWDWGNLGAEGKPPSTTVGDVVTGANLANSAGNAVAGQTGSGISTASHSTSWQHRVGSEIGQAAQKAENGRRFGPVQGRISGFGKLAGRLAIIPTIWEGYWDIGSMLYCGATSR